MCHSLTAHIAALVFFTLGRFQVTGIAVNEYLFAATQPTSFGQLVTFAGTFVTLLAKRN
jgi:hypothetical protein